MDEDYALPRFPGLDARSAQDREVFVTMLLQMGYDPSGIGAVMQLESGFSTSIHGPKAFSKSPGYPIGLIQFSPDTAEALGTSTAALERMTFAEQLAYVVKYYGRFGGPSAFTDPGDYYLAGWGANPRTPNDQVLATEGQAAYTANKGLDTDGDGRITAGELRGLIHRTIANATARGTWTADAQGMPQLSTSKRSGIAGTAAALAIGAAAVLLFVATLRPGKRRRLAAS